jgi:hypothetical protein
MFKQRQNVLVGSLPFLAVDIDDTGDDLRTVGQSWSGYVQEVFRVAWLRLQQTFGREQELQVNTHRPDQSCLSADKHHIAPVYRRLR